MIATPAKGVIPTQSDMNLVTSEKNNLSDAQGDGARVNNDPRAGNMQRQNSQPPRRDKRDIHGWIVLDKPIGMTSTQAVAVVKRLFSAKRAGHAGTLDPLASGGLPGYRFDIVLRGENETPFFLD